ncbi:MAG: HNH endonuclease [Planctomycetes bacterium]|nr:HNH endonuclease [Planctomycetota bacterium]
MGISYTAEQFSRALRAITPSSHQLKILRIHYSYVEKDITATQLAREMGYSNYVTINNLYGRLARAIGEALGIKKMPEIRLKIIVEFEKRNDGWHWIMRPQFSKAIKKLGWEDKYIDASILPNEISESLEYAEGARKKIYVNAYERDRKARDECIRHYGWACSICGLKMESVYGEIGKEFIHVHHIRPLSSTSGKRTINPIKDLRPVCPNCHAMLHRKDPPMSIEALKKELI